MNFAEYYNGYYFHNVNLFRTIAVSYLPLIFTLKHFMKDRKPYKSHFANNCLGCWNLFLGISSGIGAYYSLPFLFNDIRKNGLTNSICEGNFMKNDTVSHVCILFGLSKFFEFIDTLFIIFRKADLQFLHYYHHIMTCIISWYAGYLLVSTAVYFSSINLFVHTIMYSYYALLAFNINFVYPYRKLITVIQTSQMVFGQYITCKWLLQCNDYSQPFHVVFFNPQYIYNLSTFFMFVSYTYLFSILFFNNKNKRLK